MINEATTHCVCTSRLHFAASKRDAIAKRVITMSKKNTKNVESSTSVESALQTKTKQQSENVRIVLAKLDEIDIAKEYSSTREFDIASQTRTAKINRCFVAAYLANVRLKASEVEAICETNATHSHVRTLTVVRETAILEVDANKTYRLTEYACDLLDIAYVEYVAQAKTTKKTSKKKVSKA